MQKNPQLIFHIKDAILSIRAVVLSINEFMAQNLILELIWTEFPKLLRKMADAAGSFPTSIFSIATVKSFFYQELNYFIRKSKQDG